MPTLRGVTVPPPRLDEARRRLRLTDDQLRALRDRCAGRELLEEQQDDVAALHEGGLLLGDRVHPLALDLVRALELPVLQLAVDVLGAQGATTAHVLVAGTDVWSSDPWPDDDGLVVWTRTGVPTLMWDLTRLVGLRPLRVPADAAPVETDLLTVDGVIGLLALLSPGEQDRARETALLAGAERVGRLSEPDQLQWTALLISLESTWRVTAVWGAGDTARLRSLAVLDCGARGYWLRVLPEEPTRPADLDPATPLRLEPVDAGRLWELVSALLPSGAELRTAAGA